MNTSKRRTRKGQTKGNRLKSKEFIVDFESWFFFALKDGRVKSFQKAELKVFFKVKGLSDKEEKSRFDNILKLY